MVGVKRLRSDVEAALPETVIREGDLLIVAGSTAKVEAFAAWS